MWAQKWGVCNSLAQVVHFRKRDQGGLLCRGPQVRTHTCQRRQGRVEKAFQTQQEARAGIQSQGLKDVFSSHVGEKGKRGGGWEAGEEQELAPTLPEEAAGTGEHFEAQSGYHRKLELGNGRE